MRPASARTGGRTSGVASPRTLYTGDAADRPCWRRLYGLQAQEQDDAEGRVTIGANNIFGKAAFGRSFCLCCEVDIVVSSQLIERCYKALALRDVPAPSRKLCFWGCLDVSHRRAAKQLGGIFSRNPGVRALGYSFGWMLS